MNSFVEVLAGAIERGVVVSDEDKKLAGYFWDAALCLVQQRAFDRGDLRPAEAIMNGVSAMHTWEGADFLTKNKNDETK